MGLSGFSFSKVDKRYKIEFDSQNRVSIHGFYGKFELPFWLRGLLPISSKRGISYCFLRYDVARLFVKLLQLAVVSVQNGYFVELRLKGVEYKVFHWRTFLVLQLGYTHEVLIELPTDIFVKYGRRRRLILFAFDKQRLYQFARSLYELRRPDSFKGKGVRYMKRPLELKVGKQR